MKTAAFIRLHRFSYKLPIVFNAIAECADALYFLAHDVKDDSIVRAAQSHPKCAGYREYHPPTHPKWLRVPPVNILWTNRCSLAAIYQWADEIEPDEVMTFDEDELPPVHIAQELEAWRSSGVPSMVFRWVWSWGNEDTIICGIPRKLSWHCKVVRWKRGLGRGAFPWCFPQEYITAPRYVCPYPMRHLQIITDDVQRARNEKKWLNEYPVIPYDKNMTWGQFMQRTKRGGMPVARDNVEG